VVNAYVDTRSGLTRAVPTCSDVASTGQQQELLDFLFECESLAQTMLNEIPNSALMEHAVELCEGYLKNLLDLQQVRQRWQRAQSQGSDLRIQLEKIRHVLQKVAQQASNNARNHQDNVGQVRYWNTMGGLIDEVLRLSRQQTMLPHLPEAGASPTPPPPSESVHEPDTQLPLQLNAHLFGKFNASLNGREMRRWPGGKGLKLFKYLLLHRHIPIPKERLMETFWPDTDTQAARNNLNVALYHLRQDFSRYHKSFTFVHYREGCYLLNQELDIWVDIEVFDHHLRTAQQHAARYEIAQAISAYHRAEAIYQGDCLQEDQHEEWAAHISQAYRLKYLGIVAYLGMHTLEAGDYQECTALWQKAVALDSCNEQAHQHIIQCYLKMGQRQMALRQYQLCAEALQRELGLEPSAETQQCLERIYQVAQ